MPSGEFQAAPAATPEFTDRSPRLRERSTRAAATSPVPRGRESVETCIRRGHTRAQIRPRAISITVNKATPPDRGVGVQNNLPVALDDLHSQHPHPVKGNPRTRLASIEGKDGEATRDAMNRYHGLVKHSYWARQNRHQGIMRSRLRDPSIEISSTATISMMPLTTLTGVHLRSSKFNLRSGSSEYPSRYRTRFESTWLQNSAEYTRGYLALSSA